MTNIYPDPLPNHKKNGLKPKEETVSFLLNYSKALHVVNHGTTQFDFISN